MFAAERFSNRHGVETRGSLVVTDQARPQSMLVCFTNIFNQSLWQSAVSTRFKRTTVVPVPKKAKVTELNDYRLAALTSVISAS